MRAEGGASARAGEMEEQLQSLHAQRQQCMHELRHFLATSADFNEKEFAFQRRARSKCHDGDTLQELGSNILKCTIYRDCAARLQELSDLTKIFGKDTRNAEVLFAQDKIQEAVQVSLKVTDIYKVIMQQHTLVTQDLQKLEEDVRPLSTFLGQMRHKQEVSRNALYESITPPLREHLALCGWPPPIVSRQANSPGKHYQQNGVDHDAANDHHAADIFAPEHYDSIQKLHRLMVALTGFQLAEQHESFSDLSEGTKGQSIEGPILWIAIQLAEPLSQKLQVHFASHMETGRLDKPEWLFSTVLRLIKDYASSVEIFQGVVEAYDLDTRYLVSVEFARALRQTVRSMLSTDKLPGLLELGSADLWLHYLDATVDFEKRMAPFMCILLDQDDSNESLPVLLLKESCLCAFGEDPNCLEAWVEAERESALQQLEVQVASARAWTFTAEILQSGSSLKAWEQESYSTFLSDGVSRLMLILSQRARNVPNAPAVETYSKRVIGSVIRGLHGHLVQTMNLFEENHLLLKATDKVCACLCTAHHLDISIPDMSSQLLIFARQISHELATTSSAPSVLDRESQILTSFWRAWTLKLGNSLGNSLTKLAKNYVTALDRFSLKTDPAEDGIASPGLVDMLSSLQESLVSLSNHLDATCFREVWKVAALSLNRLMYNDVATEARFNAAGAMQFSTDMNVLMSIFGRYTGRPQAHFKESMEAGTVLCWDSDKCEEFMQAVTSSQPVLPSSQSDLLKKFGINHLSLEQTTSVLSQRLH